MSREGESGGTISHLEYVYRYAQYEEAGLLGRATLMRFATDFAQKSYELLNRFALPRFKDVDGLVPGTVTTEEILIPATPVIGVRIQADLIAGGWDSWERSWRNLGLHFQAGTAESSLLIPNIGWEGRQIVPSLDSNSPQSFIEFKNALDVLSYLERRMSVS